jgi:hypothetical protein
MFELRNPKREVVRLVAPHEPQLRDHAVDQLVAPEPGLLGITTPAREGLAYRAP